MFFRHSTLPHPPNKKREKGGDKFTTMGVSYIYSSTYQKTVTSIKVKCRGKLLPYKNFMQGTSK
jgi:hypothetical protein